MSNVARVAGQAANTLTTPPNVEDVFSTYLYTGNGSTQTITNGVDLAGEGGLVWQKRRSSADSHVLSDTVRGLGQVLQSDTTGANQNLTSLFGYQALSDGFSFNTANSLLNTSGSTYASWTFRKAPKFFDVVTYTGTGSAQTISHNLGAEVGCIMVKATSIASNWAVWHKSFSIPTTNYLRLNSTNAVASDANYWNSTAPTSSAFSVGASATTNSSGATYVAYLFAHNDGDGEFGPDGDADIIKCGSYAGDGGAGTTEVNLGFEPQWILVKASSAADSWFIIDNMRGWATHNNTANDAYLLPNATNAESTGGFLDITSTGFKTTLYTNVNVSGRDYIYIAIRRGPMAVPTSGTDVFDIDLANPGSSTITTPFPVDLSLGANRAGSVVNFSAIDRLRGGKGLRTNTTDAEQTITVTLDSMDSFSNAIFGTGNHLFYSWKRAPKYFDVVAYTGDGVAGRTVSHNLGVAPEMMWVKQRSTTGDWGVYHKDVGNDKVLILNANIAETSLSTAWNNTTPAATEFTVGTWTRSNGNNNDIIAYLFASLDGVSKVGSYTGNGSSQTIDCGFNSGARFVLIKCSNDTGDWNIFDTERGIVAGNDSRLTLNTTDPELTSYDAIDPSSSGFIVNTAISDINDSGQTYIFYAIA